MMILPPTMDDGHGSSHGRHDLRWERPDPIGVAMMRLHPVEAVQSFGSRFSQTVHAVFGRLRSDRRNAPAIR
jgi:hypothetical protein